MKYRLNVWGGSDVKALSSNIEGKIPAGEYYIISLQSGKALDAANNTLLQPAIQWGFHGSALQQWELIDKGNYYLIKSVAFGNVLHTMDGSKNNGATIMRYTNFNGANAAQKWTLEKAGYNAFEIKNVWSGKYLDLSGSSYANGGTMAQWDRNFKDNQKWLFYPVSN
ncbi:RICIN domain-containing protein [endosymbiont 'TC1' of Trimyema compressum]|uniref:RICIN domain-containing protein n=1 Tax=endosymbiont 'TC1' of Trimyema compressum TaxID=243899 RepID=UPI000B4D5193